MENENLQSESNTEEKLIVSSLVRNFVPRKKSKNHHAALNRISF